MIEFTQREQRDIWNAAQERPVTQTKGQDLGR